MEDNDDDSPPLLVVGDVASAELVSCEDSSESERVPVTVITGFLGAGKTTLLQRLLTEQCKKRYAVIMNEMAPGSGSVESAFFQAVNRARAQQADASSEENSMLSALSEWIDLPGGCLCCVKNAGLRAIERLVERRHDIDHILIETSGVADPFSLISTFWTDAEMKSSVRLNGVVAVIDAHCAFKWLVDDFAALDTMGMKTGSISKHDDANAQSQSQSDLRHVFWNQISLSDLLIVNKTDLLSCKQPLACDDALNAIDERLRQLNPFARLQRCKFAQVSDVGQLLDSLCAYDPATIGELRQMQLTTFGDAPGAQSLHSHVTLQVAKVVFTRAQHAACVFDREKLQKLFADLVWTAGSGEGRCNIVRLKAMALVAVTGAGLTWFHVQAVNELLDETEVCAPEVDCTQFELGMFVFIGYNLDENRLREHLSGCLSV